MLKQTVTYEDFDGETRTEDLYFNISKTEITEHLDLEDKFKDVLDIFAGGERQLTTPELQRYLALVKYVMQLSYGVRSEDGKRFRKSPALWEDFNASAAYDAYLYSLFVNPEKANDFLAGVLPADLRAQAQQEIEKNGGVLPKPLQSAPVAPTLDTEAELTDEELLKMHPIDMTPEQAERAYKLRFEK